MAKKKSTKAPAVVTPQREREIELLMNDAAFQADLAQKVGDARAAIEALTKPKPKADSSTPDATGLVAWARQRLEAKLAAAVPPEPEAYECRLPVETLATKLEE
jgi:hypothetical protein